MCFSKCVTGFVFQEFTLCQCNKNLIVTQMWVSSWTVGLKYLCDRMTSSLWHYSVCCHGNGRESGQYGVHGNEMEMSLTGCVGPSKPGNSEY